MESQTTQSRDSSRYARRLNVISRRECVDTISRAVIVLLDNLSATLCRLS